MIRSFNAELDKTILGVVNTEYGDVSEDLQEIADMNPKSQDGTALNEEWRTETDSYTAWGMYRYNTVTEMGANSMTICHESSKGRCVMIGKMKCKVNAIWMVNNVGDDMYGPEGQKGKQYYRAIFWDKNNFSKTWERYIAVMEESQAKTLGNLVTSWLVKGKKLDKKYNVAAKHLFHFRPHDWEKSGTKPLTPAEFGIKK